MKKLLILFTVLLMSCGEPPEHTTTGTPIYQRGTSTASLKYSVYKDTIDGRVFLVFYGAYGLQVKEIEKLEE